MRVVEELCVAGKAKAKEKKQKQKCFDREVVSLRVVVVKKEVMWERQNATVTMLIDRTSQNR